MDVLWQTDSSGELWADLTGFASMLDSWRLALSAEGKDESRRVAVSQSKYEIDPSDSSSLFSCPSCSSVNFHVLEGVYEGDPVVGLACAECESYGAVFPCGL